MATSTSMECCSEGRGTSLSPAVSSQKLYLVYSFISCLCPTASKDFVSFPGRKFHVVGNIQSCRQPHQESQNSPDGERHPLIACEMPGNNGQDLHKNHQGGHQKSKHGCGAVQIAGLHQEIGDTSGHPANRAGHRAHF